MGEVCFLLDLKKVAASPLPHLTPPLFSFSCHLCWYEIKREINLVKCEVNEEVFFCAGWTDVGGWRDVVVDSGVNE